MKTALIMMGIFWIVAIVLWQVLNNSFYILNFGYIGTAIGIGIGLYSALPKKQKHIGRKLAQLLVGIYMLAFLGFIEFENMQTEGFFFYLLAGLIAGAVLHYLVAKIIGPLVFNRGWCGWACWTAMVLDYLPFPRNKTGRLATRWGSLRYLHLLISLGLVLGLWFGVGYRVQEGSVNELYWLAAGNIFYFAIAITLAFTLKDNRAFCKYACPIATFLKASSRFALLKIAGDAEICTDCGACEKVCPMDIRIRDYIQNGKRVLSTECILCFECENVCTSGSLKSSWGFDCGRHELLNMKKR